MLRRLLFSNRVFYYCYFFRQFKANIYLHWALSGDLESQKKGFIAIFCWPSKDTLARSFPRPGDEEFAYGRKLIEGVPWRMCAMHMCFPDTPVFQLMRSGMFLIMGERRARIRLHLGKRGRLHCRCFLRVARYSPSNFLFHFLTQGTALKINTI